MPTSNVARSALSMSREDFGGVPGLPFRSLERASSITGPLRRFPRIRRGVATLLPQCVRVYACVCVCLLNEILSLQSPGYFGLTRVSEREFLSQRNIVYYARYFRIGGGRSKRRERERERSRERQRQGFLFEPSARTALPPLTRVRSRPLAGCCRLPHRNGSRESLCS